MQYIVMDLEWNNAYAKKRAGFMNEVIEVGAVKLDASLRETDVFSMLVHSQIGKKLRGSVKRLTNITTADLADAKFFTQVLSLFRKWLGDGENVILTWGDGDIRVLLDNYQYLNGVDRLSFLQNYADLQTVVQDRLRLETKNQIGLEAAALLLEIPLESYAQHRALDDSRLGAECLRRVFTTEQVLKSYIRVCDESFYQKLAFKPRVLRDMRHPLIDKKAFWYRCQFCGSEDVEQLTDWNYHNQFFRAEYYCPHCEKTVRAGIRFKAYYDRVDVRRIASEIVPEVVSEEEDPVG